MSADAGDPPAVALHDASVMIVEDHTFVRDLVRRLLTSLTVPRVVAADTAEDAFAALEGDPGACDVLVVDFELPGMNGVQLIERLRAAAHPALHAMPVVMLTGHNDLAVYREAARLGIAAFLVKPAGPAALKAALEEALAGRRLAVPRAPSDPPEA